MKKIWDRWLREFVLIYCSLYTIMTIENSVLYLMQGVYEDPSGNWHEIDRAIIMFIGVTAYELATKLPIKNLFVRAIAVYVPTLLLVYAYVWSTVLREPLAPTAFRDITYNYTGLFVIVLLVVMCREALKKRRAKTINE